MMEFLTANWDTILAIVLLVATIAAAAFFAFRGSKSVVYKMLFAFVTDAEAAFGPGTGELKLASVITWVYPKLPTIIRTFISAKTLESWVEIVLEEAKKTWSNNDKIADYIGK